MPRPPFRWPRPEDDEYKPPKLHIGLQYGVWSGPGYSAGKFRRGVNPLTSEERRYTGKDAFDNYVSKPHDLNEYDAEASLRSACRELGLIDEKTRFRTGQTDENGDEIKHGGGTRTRFVDFIHYRDKARARHREAVAKAFLNYYIHVTKSNLQFCLDYPRNVARGALINAQLAGAPHIFISEASELRPIIDRIVTDHPGAYNWSDILAYLRNRFVHVTHGDIEPIREKPRYVLTPEQIFACRVGQAVDLFSAQLDIRRFGAAKDIKLVDRLRTKPVDALASAIREVEGKAISARNGDSFRGR